MNTNPLLAVDFYKQSHYKMYPENTTKIYSNLTPRKSRIPGINYVVNFGLQYYIKEYLIKNWNEQFFNKPKDEVISKFKRMMDNTLGKDSIDTTHIEKLHDLGYLPLEIKALPEGSVSPIRVPVVTITNTVDHAYWLVNFLETSLSYSVWQSTTSATIANHYRMLLNKYALETTGSINGVEFIGHDFALRGMSSHESGALSGAGHLLSFKGTDTIPAIEFLEEYYGADVTKELVGCSVPATEHSIMCMGTQESEIKTFERLLDLYPEGILSVVSDTWNLWTVCTDFLPKMKDKIMGRNGKLVIRPDSGDPVDIICGAVNWTKHSGLYDSTQMSDWRKKMIPEDKGVIELLWDVFGGTVNELGYKVLDPHIGAIYGDSITLDRAEQICERLKAKGFASTNVVLGIGSYTYQYNTRDTFGFAIKATYGEVRTVGSHGLSNPIGREIFKDPITDDGTKKSAKGLLCVKEVIENNNKTYELKDQVSNEEEKTGALKTVFKDGILLVDHSLQEIRERLAK